MFRRNLIHFVSSFILVISLGACSSGKQTAAPVTTPTVPIQTQSIIQNAPIQCSASINKSIAAAEEMLTLTIQASGGSGSYSIPGLVSNFAQSTNLYGSFHNTGTANLNISRSVDVYDSAGAKATCSFTVQITPGSGGGVVPVNGLVCQINVASNPQPGVATQFTIIGAGAPAGATYTFSQFSPDAGVLIPTTAVSTTANSATVSATYTYPIAKYTTASISVSATGVALPSPCELRLSVNSPNLLVTGSTSSTVGSPIRLRLTAVGFGYAPVKYFGYSVTEPNIDVSIVENGAYGYADLTIRALDNAEHAAFNLDATVNTPNGVVVTKRVSLSFSQPLNCTLSQLDIPTRVNSDTRFQMTASTGEALQITELVAASNVVNSSGLNVNPIRLKFPSIGYHYFSVKAKSTTRNVFCNNGNSIGFVAEVRTALTGCSVAATVDPAVVQSSVTFTAVLPDNSGSGPFTVNLSTNGSTIDVAPASGLSKTIAFWNSGYYHVVMSVRDNTDGTTVTCDRWETVNQPSHGLQAKFWDIPNNSTRPTWGSPRYLTVPGRFDSLPVTPQATFSVDTIDVPTTLWYHGFPNLPYGLGTKTEYFAISYNGRIWADQEGDYSFQTISDDGVELYIERELGSGLINVINNDGFHAPTANTGTIHLTRGFHKIKLDYFQGPLSLFAIQLKWRPPYHGNMHYNIVPAGALFAP